MASGLNELYLSMHTLSGGRHVLLKDAANTCANASGKVESLPEFWRMLLKAPLLFIMTRALPPCRLTEMHTEPEPSMLSTVYTHSL